MMSDTSSKKRAKPVKKIRPECAGCRYFIGGNPDDVACRKGNNPTYYRKKKTCEDRAFKKKKAIAYTDGSYNPATKCFGTGVCLYIDGKKHNYTDSGFDNEGGRQVKGEINGAIIACEKAIEHGCTEIEIRYDYNGIEAWALGFWQTNKPYTIKYASDIKHLMGLIKISFKHVKAHKGESGNEHADTLAKKACGVPTTKTKAKKHSPNIPDGVNEECKKSIMAFYKKTNPVFQDYMSLKTYGTDEFSKKGFEELKKYAAQSPPDDIMEKLGEQANGKDYCSCVRWMMRGLAKEDAIRKVQIDIEIRNNYSKQGD